MKRANTMIISKMEAVARSAARDPVQKKLTELERIINKYLHEKYKSGERVQFKIPFGLREPDLRNLIEAYHHEGWKTRFIIVPNKKKLDWLEMW